MSLHQNLIGISRWIIELGGIANAFQVSALSRYLYFPLNEHLVQALNVFKYLEIHYVNDLALDHCYQCVTSSQNMQSKVQVVKDLYADDGEEITSNTLKPGEKPVQVAFLVNSDHGGDIKTHRPQTGIILNCNSESIM